jgi:hypothetical protein
LEAALWRWVISACVQTSLANIMVSNSDSSTASTFGTADIYVPNYAYSGNYKSVSTDSVSENNTTTAYATLTLDYGQIPAAITIIKLEAIMVVQFC